MDAGLSNALLMAQAPPELSPSRSCWRTSLLECSGLSRPGPGEGAAGMSLSFTQTEVAKESRHRWWPLHLAQNSIPTPPGWAGLGPVNCLTGEITGQWLVQPWRCQGNQVSKTLPRHIRRFPPRRHAGISTAGPVPPHRVERAENTLVSLAGWGQGQVKEHLQGSRLVLSCHLCSVSCAVW